MSPGPASLPKFWEHEAGLYFSAIENIFKVKRITDNETKSDNLLAALNVRHFQKLRHVLPNLSPKHSYQQLKTALLQRYAPSEDENLECLLHQTRLTSDITPSQLLARMRSLIGEDHAPERLLRKLFLDSFQRVRGE